MAFIKREFNQVYLNSDHGSVKSFMKKEEDPLFPVVQKIFTG